MPKFGNGSSRPGAGDRKPRHGKTGAPTGAGHASGKGKEREDGRGGRSPQRAAFFEAKKEAPKGRSYADRDDRGSRDERPARGDWSPRGDRNDRPAGRVGYGDRPAYGDRNRSDRPSYGDRNERPSYGDRDRSNGGREDRRKDWAPREERPAGRGGFGGNRGGFGGNRDDRPARDDRNRSDRPYTPRDGGDRNDRPRRDGGFDFNDRPKRDFGDRSFSDRPRFGDRDDRRSGGDRSFSDRPKRDFGDRPRFGDRDNSGTDRRADRPDRVERDRARQGSFDDRRATTPNKKAFSEDVVLERLESVEDAVVIGSFEEMGLHPRLVTALQGMGAESPFPIQAATIPAALEGQDVLGRGKTGSGKTVAFCVPVITKLVNGGSQPRKPNKPRALILAPTRELADQIDRTASQLARAVGFYTTTVYGGVPQRKQEIAMSRGVDILVATPGRLEDLMAQRIVDLSEVETIVIDEADHMCDLGFIEGVRRIMAATGDSQKLLFSATLDREVDALVKEFLPNPFTYEVPNEANDTANITHRVLIMHDQDRSPVLLRLVQGAGKAIIFCRTKATAESLSESLTEAGVPAARLHGDLNQNQRNRNLERFTRGGTRVLVATDVAARGIHVDDVDLVIQLDPPLEYKTYLHRSGRTGRAGKEGTVVTMIPRQRRRRIEDLLNRAERDGIYTEVYPNHELLEQLAGPIAPAPAVDTLDFGSGGRGGDGPRGGRSGGRGGYGRDRDDRGGRSGGGRGNYGGNGKGRWADRPEGTDRPRKKRADA
jgi:superfamily II DNA/RNA helicase